MEPKAGGVNQGHHNKLWIPRTDTAHCALASINSQACLSCFVTSNLLSDGSCFYPIPDSDFPDLIHFVGRWFQVAATVDPSSPPDTCKYADINMNTTDNSLLVTSVCQRGGNQLVEHGTAEPAPSQFGSAGAFILRFVGVEVPGQNCPGPNYVVQSFDADAGWAIVQTPSFASMQLLSRQPVRSDRDIQRWLKKAGNLGANLSTVAQTPQKNCPQ
ncbi:hypothetical protein P8C59_009195 [Phyllachora maydis]|uniref:Lipocalin/cytosolic fatty-acid binding domain-containing protein n=1 Tax=Phyllachora maydis TaxID=1825666 RepID=A0AAD9IC04_9PEZI|nr:hypothetical protein P8C59_009195 [Phyllachora maydis]